MMEDRWFSWWLSFSFISFQLALGGGGATVSFSQAMLARIFVSVLIRSVGRSVGDALLWFHDQGIEPIEQTCGKEK